MKYTIKELIDTVFDKERFLNKYSDWFTHDDIDYAINKDTTDLYYIIYYLHHKFNKQNIITVMNTGKVEWIINKRNLWNRELVKILIPKIENSYILNLVKYYLIDFFDQETQKLYEEQCEKL